MNLIRESAEIICVMGQFRTEIQDSSGKKTELLNTCYLGRTAIEDTKEHHIADCKIFDVVYKIFVSIGHDQQSTSVITIVEIK